LTTGKVTPRLIAVIGRQRSGTTVLRQFIGSAERSFDLGEVFHANTARKLSFWGFVHDMAAADPKFRFPLRWPDAWDAFIDRTSTERAADVLVFDVKVEYFPIILRTDGDATGFFFDHASVSYIWLRRRNTAAQVISRHVAAKSGIWSETDPDARPGLLERRYAIWGGQADTNRCAGDILIDPEDIMREINVVERQDETIDRMLGDKFDLRLTYEELFDTSGNFDTKVVESVAALTGLEAGDFERRPVLRRQRRRSVLDGIGNARDIVTRFAGTGHEWMLNA